MLPAASVALNVTVVSPSGNAADLLKLHQSTLTPPDTDSTVKICSPALRFIVPPVTSWKSPHPPVFGTLTASTSVPLIETLRPGSFPDGLATRYLAI